MDTRISLLNPTLVQSPWSAPAVQTAAPAPGAALDVATRWSGTPVEPSHHLAQRLGLGVLAALSLAGVAGQTGCAPPVNVTGTTYAQPALSPLFLQDAQGHRLDVTSTSATGVGAALNADGRWIAAGTAGGPWGTRGGRSR